MSFIKNRNLRLGVGLVAAVLLLVGCITPETVTRGTPVPWTRYEAEDASTNGIIAPATRLWRTPGAEASERRFVSLNKLSDFIEFKVKRKANGLTLRYSIPDSPNGKGLDETINLLVNGKHLTPISLTSRFSWVYGEYPWSNDPKDGKGHCFFDEVHVLIPQVAAGDTIRLQIRPDGPPLPCLIDFIELEPVSPPLSEPQNALSVMAFGAMPNDKIDDSKALMACIAKAKEQDKIVWIPPGSFVLNGKPKSLGGVIIRGAGIWYSCLTGTSPMFYGNGESFAVSDLAMVGQVAQRENNVAANAFHGNLGDGSVLARLWIEHFKCGVWSTKGTKNLRIADCRIRNTMADGVNFCDGTSDSVVEDCHFRNTGDDAIATWSPSAKWSSGLPCQRNRFFYNTIETPWLANGIGIYGGGDHQVIGNRVIDTVYSGGGLLISSGHGAIPFSGSILVEDNTFIRTGGECYIGEKIGGVWIHAKDSDINIPIIIRNLKISGTPGPSVTIHGQKNISKVKIENLQIK